MSVGANGAVRHLPRADAELIGINLFVTNMTKRVTVGIRKDMHYKLKKGQILLSDARTFLEEAREGMMVWRIEDNPTFAMAIEYCDLDKQWKIIRADFFYRDCLDQDNFFKELSALGFRPRKIESLLRSIA